MGRSGRPRKDTRTDILRELGEEGVPPGWIDYWQGVRQIREGVISPLCPSMQDGQIERLSQEFVPRREWMQEMVSSSWSASSFSTKDPLLQALWKQEELRFQRWLDLYEEATGSTSIFSKIDIEAVRDKWFGHGFAIELSRWIHDGQNNTVSFPKASILYHIADSRSLTPKSEDEKESFWHQVEAELLVWKKMGLDSYLHFLKEEGTEMLEGVSSAMEYNEASFRDFERDYIRHVFPDYDGPDPQTIANIVFQQGGISTSYMDKKRGVLLQFLGSNSWKEVFQLGIGKDSPITVRGASTKNTEEDIIQFARSVFFYQFTATQDRILQHSESQWEKFWEARIEEIIAESDHAISRSVAKERIREEIYAIDLDDLRPMLDGRMTLEELFQSIHKR